MDHGQHDAASDEPQTPMWLPALGIALFLAYGVWWAMLPASHAPAAPEPVASASASAAPVVSAAPARPTPMPMPMPAPPRRRR